MKRKIRAEMMKKRAAMNKEDLLSRSAVICETLRKLEEFKNAKNVLFYVSTKNEVETQVMLKELLKAGEKNIVVPVTDKKTSTLNLSLIKDFSELVPKTHEILEPADEFVRPVSPEKIDLVITPGIAFDENGNRIGSGCGYYDRLLCGMKNAKKIGLAFELQILPKLPCYDHDVPLDIIITEERIIRLDEKRRI